MNRTNGKIIDLSFSYYIMADGSVVFRLSASVSRGCHVSYTSEGSLLYRSLLRLFFFSIFV